MWGCGLWAVLHSVHQCRCECASYYEQCSLHVVVIGVHLSTFPNQVPGCCSLVPMQASDQVPGCCSLAPRQAGSAQVDVFHLQRECPCMFECSHVLPRMVKRVPKISIILPSSALLMSSLVIGPASSSPRDDIVALGSKVYHHLMQDVSYCYND